MAWYQDVKLMFGLAACLASAAVTSANAQSARNQASAQTSDELPPGFRGKVVYQGDFSAEAFRAGRAPANASPIVRRIAERNNRSWTENGTITVTVEYDGARISGYHVGSGGMGRGSFTGTRNGRSCTISAGQGDSNTVNCTRTMWSGTSRSAPGARVESSVDIRASASSLVDFAESAPPRGITWTRNGPSQLGNTGMARCSAFGFAAPQTPADLAKIPTAELLRRGQAMSLDNYCSRLYFGAAAQRSNIQGMAAYSSFFGAKEKTPDVDQQAYWCQKAFRAARARGAQHDLDSVNYFCPINTFASLMTPAERKANQASIDRAGKISAEVRAEVEAIGRAMWNDMLTPPPSMPSGDDEVIMRSQNKQRYGCESPPC